jgi:flagellar biosynthesis chaperone FliJ
VNAKRKGLSRLRLLASLREERAQRAVSDAARVQADAEAAHVTQLEQFRQAQVTEPVLHRADVFLQQREAQAMQVRAVEKTDAMVKEAAAQVARSKNDLLEAARERMTYDRLDARARATQAALVARASMRALDDLNGQRRKP